MHVYTAAEQDAAQKLAQDSLDRLKMHAPLDGPVSPADLNATVGQTVTEAGLGADRIIALWQDVLAPACISSDHPRYLSFIPSAPTKAAAAFDMLVGASSLYAGSWLEGSGAVYAENQALRWLADLAGFPESAGGVFVQGGTIGNLSALVTARHQARARRIEADQPLPTRWSVIMTEETHSSVHNGLVEVMDVDAVTVPGDERGRLTGTSLRDYLDELEPSVADGIFAVVATAGNTNLGAVDDIAGVAEVAQDHHWWLHVDGAYGGAGLAAPSVRGLFDGIEAADSFIVDPHKWLFAPFDSCALIYRDPAAAAQTHTQRASYLEVINQPGAWNPSDYAIQLTRRARGLPFWFSLAVHGTSAYRDAIEHTLEIARGARALIDATEYLELVTEPQLSVLVFRRKGWSHDEYVTWSTELLNAGIAFVVPTSHRGAACARFAIVNPTTTLDDISQILASMR